MKFVAKTQTQVVNRRIVFLRESDVVLLNGERFRVSFHHWDKGNAEAHVVVVLTHENDPSSGMTITAKRDTKLLAETLGDVREPIACLKDGDIVEYNDEPCVVVRGYYQDHHVIGLRSLKVNSCKTVGLDYLYKVLEVEVDHEEG